MSMTYSNWPMQIEKEAYAKARDEVIGRFKDEKGFLAVYEWGSVSLPGISDLDLVVIFEEKAKPLPLLKRSFFTLSKETRYVAFHPSIYCTKMIFENMTYLNPTSSFKHLFGKKLNILKITKAQEQLCLIALLNDLIIRHYPRDFLPVRTMDIRNTLLRLNSLRYTIQTMEKITGKRYENWSDFSKRVKIVREQWFESKNAKELQDLYAQASDISLEIVDYFSRFLKEGNLVSISGGSKARYNAIKNKTVFEECWERKTAKERSGSVSYLPLVLAAQLFVYAKGQGLISSHIKNNLQGNIAFSITHEKILQKRISLLNMQAALATRLAHSDFPALFDFGFRTKSGINNKIVSLLDRLKY